MADGRNGLETAGSSTEISFCGSMDSDILKKKHKKVKKIHHIGKLPRQIYREHIEMCKHCT
jgi:hypothetical protein